MNRVVEGHRLGRYLRFSDLSFQAGLGRGPRPTIIWLPRYADELAITGPNDLDTDA